MPTPYRIIDEPAPGTLQQLSVNPLFPLLAVMVGGPGFGWLWFIVNGFALGSASQRREAVGIAVGLAGLALLTVALAGPWLQAMVEPGTIKYLRVLTYAWVLGISYVIFSMQDASFQIYEYMGGPAGNGVALVVAASVLGSRLAARGPVMAALFW